MNNKILLYGVIGFALLLASIIAITSAVNAGSAKVAMDTQGTGIGTKYNILRVTGSGKVSVKPDVAYLNIGVRTLDQDAKKAQGDNKAIMEQIMSKLKSMKINEKDIQTSSYNIWPKYNYNNNKEVLEGYEVENMLSITIHEVESVGDVLDAVSKEGANRSNGINFGIIDRDTIYKQALEKAIDDASSKAEVMGKKAEVSIQKPLAIYEGNAPGEVYGDNMYPRNEMMSMASDVAGVPIASGELEIQANVTIIYGTK
ncbi:MAG TPA: SIMPL domain-containing protein [Clostridia bacterium]|nr:SIMPL domain-containing protein [Clostridia bacterium]